MSGVFVLLLVLILRVALDGFVLVVFVFLLFCALTFAGLMSTPERFLPFLLEVRDVLFPVLTMLKEFWKTKLIYVEHIKSVTLWDKLNFVNKYLQPQLCQLLASYNTIEPIYISDHSDF